jgi:hypothetical protein
LAVLAMTVVLACAGAACTLLESTSGLTGGGGGTDAAIDRPAMPADSGPGDAGASPGIACLQWAAVEARDASATTAVFEAGVEAHDTIVVGVDFTSSAGSGLALTDDVGDPYQILVGPIGQYQYLAAAFDAGAGAKAVTVTTSNGAPTYFELYVHEYTGLVAFDDGAGATGTSTAMSSGPFTATQGNELIFGYAVAIGGADVAGANFTTLSTLDQNVTEQLIAATPGQYQATATMTNGLSWVVIGASFRSH